MDVDGELLLISWLTVQLDGPRVLTTLPAAAENELPIVQVARIGGTDALPRFDEARFDVDCYAVASYPGDRATVSALARTVHELLRYQLRGVVLTADGQSATVLGVHAESKPRWIYNNNPAMAQMNGTYQIGLKTRQAA